MTNKYLKTIIGISHLHFNHIARVPVKVDIYDVIVAWGSPAQPNSTQLKSF